MIYCEASRVAHVIWEVNPVGGGGPNMWISQLIPPPYFAYDRGIMGQPQPPQLVNLQLAVGDNTPFTMPIGSTTCSSIWIHNNPNGYLDISLQRQEKSHYSAVSTSCSRFKLLLWWIRLCDCWYAHHSLHSSRTDVFQIQNCICRVGWLVEVEVGGHW